MSNVNIDWQKALQVTARNLWMSALTSQSTSGKRLFDRMRNPQAGDIVTEITTPDETPNKTGVLLSQNGEGCLATWKIQTDSGIENWTNAQFIAIPMDFHWCQK